MAMTNKWTRTAAFRFYNAEPRNTMWSWSARSAHGVVLTLWKDEFIGPAGRMTYERLDFGGWHKGHGSRFFFEDLAWALEHCGGIVRVIVAVRDRSAFPHARVAECYPRKDLVMRVVHLDPVIGAFKLEQVTANFAVKSVVDSHAFAQAA